MRSIADPSPDRQPKVAPQLEGRAAPPFFIIIVTSRTSTPPTSSGALTPYHKKSAFTLGENVRRFCDLYGLRNCGFLTLTFPDNVTDHKEASRRFDNMNRRYLRTFYGEWIWVREDRKEVPGITTWSCSAGATFAPVLTGTSTASGSPTTARASAVGCAPVTRCCVPSGK